MNKVQTSEVEKDGERGTPASDHREAITGMGGWDHFDRCLENFVLRTFADALAADIRRDAEDDRSCPQGNQPSEATGKR